MSISSFDHEGNHQDIIDNNLSISHLPNKISTIKESVNGEFVRRVVVEEKDLLTAQKIAIKYKRSIVAAYSAISVFVVSSFVSLNWLIFYTLTLLDGSFIIGGFLLAIGLSLSMGTSSIDLTNAMHIFQDSFSVLPTNETFKEVSMTLIMYGADLIALVILATLTSLIITSVKAVAKAGQNKLKKKYIKISDGLFGYSLSRIVKK